MAIVVEGEKKPQTPIFSIVGWLAILAIAAAAVYYIFFAQPEFVVLVPTGGLSAIAPLTQQSSTLSQTAANEAALNTLHTTVPSPIPTGPAAVGRTNPFIAP